MRKQHRPGQLTTRQLVETLLATGLFDIPPPRPVTARPVAVTPGRRQRYADAIKLQKAQQRLARRQAAAPPLDPRIAAAGDAA